MRNISFALTTPQVRARTKTVTRRMRWLSLKVGDRLQACVKCQGRKPGEPLEVIAVIEIVSLRRERLDAITAADCAREGFPHMTPAKFVAFFCASHKDCFPESTITRIEFRYV